jgi:hypothetical protein
MTPHDVEEWNRLKDPESEKSGGESQNLARVGETNERKGTNEQD